MVSQQMAEIERIAAMTTDEAKVVLLAEVEKESRNDMARIIRQVESEARSEGEKKAVKLLPTPSNAWHPTTWLR